MVAYQADANPVSTIRTPPPHAIEALSTDSSLHALSLANLIATNCEMADIDAGDAALIAGTAQAVAGHMGLSTEDYLSTYIQTALKQFAVADACEKYAGATREIILKVQELDGVVIEPASH